MTSKFSIDNRELLQRISSGEAVVGIDFGNLIIRELAAFRLATMDSESGCLPLDYLQGHKDGLEWAAQLAEANHPETGDWLYDDPIELAKAIRKGPDMPPAQPVADSEPDRNPVLAYADSYRDMAKQGVESVPIWSVITDLERNIAPLYRHAQPASVVPELRVDWQENEFSAGWNACRAAMLQAGNSPAQSDCCPAQNVVVPAQSPIDHGYLPECECSGCKATARICTEMAVNSLVIPNEMTSEQAYEIGYYYGDPVDVFARGANWMRQHIIDSTLAAAPHDTPALNSVQSVDSVADRWIPVSERMPEDSGRYWCYVEEQNDLGKSHYQWNCSWNGDRWWVESEGGGIVTHWMQLPAAPQEVKGD